MAVKQVRSETRQTILQAAAEIVRSRGAGSLTLEAAADAAGISKGGLLYHFPTKDALIEGMVADGLARFEADVETAVEVESPGKSRWLRAFVKTTFAAEPEHDVSAGLMAAAAVNPALLAPVGVYFARWQARSTSDGVKPTVATIVRLAADGLWFADLFDAAPPDDRLRAELLEALLQMIADAESESGSQESPKVT
jgi:AcrR family transcriptional regulator